MANFHRLATPSYHGGLPVGYDLINTPSDPSVGGAGVPAFADDKKVGGPNDGVYFVAFGEDATSNYTNRGLKALATNTDFLDDILHRDLALTTRTNDVTAGSNISSVVISGDVFVGALGTSNTADSRQRLISVLDSNDNEIIDSSGNTVVPSLIHDGSSTNVVGTQTSGFYTSPTVNFSPAIPSGTTYRIYYGERSNLATLPISAFTDIIIRGAEEVDGVVEKQLRNLHAPGNLQAWDQAWDSTIRALAASGLNERYRRGTGVPSSFNFDTPGDGALIIRDGKAPTVQGTALTLGSVANPDPILALWRAMADPTTVAGTSWPNPLNGGDVGYYHETDYNASRTVNEVSRPGVAGPGYLDVVPRDIRSGTLGSQALFFINPTASATLNPDSGTGVGARQTIQCAAGQYFKIPSGGNAGKTGIRVGLDLVEVTTGGVTTVYIITFLVSATRINCAYLAGQPADFGATAAAATIRILQPLVSLGGSVPGNAQFTNYLAAALFAPPLPIQIGGDSGTTKFSPPLFLSPDSADIEPPGLFDSSVVALSWGYASILDGSINKTGQLRGDGQIRTMRGSWQFSVGDGVNTFGDFNGANAIRQLIDYLNSLNATWSSTVLVKGSGYLISGSADTLTIPTGCCLNLVGAQGDNTPGVALLNSTGGTLPTFTVSGALALLGVNLTSVSIGAQPAIVMGAASSDAPRLKLVNCRLGASPIRFVQSSGPNNSVGDYSLYAENVVFDPGSSSSGHAFECVTATNSAVVGSVKFVGCKFIGVQNQALILFAPSVTGGMLINNLIFEDCSVLLAGSSGGINNGTNNSGIFQILTTTSYSSGWIRNILFQNCNVLASGPRPLLMYITVGDNFKINQFTIRGGAWLCDSTNTTVSINPFTIAPLTPAGGFGDLPIYAVGGEPAVSVIIENCFTGYATLSGDWPGTITSAGNYGTNPGEQSAHLPLGWSPTLWGCWTVRSENITLRKVKFIGGIAKSTIGEFQLFGTYNTDVDDLVIYTTGGANGNGAYPNERVSIIAGSPYSGRATVSKLAIDGRGAKQATKALLLFHDVPASAPSTTFRGWRLVIDKCDLGKLDTFSTCDCIGYGNGSIIVDMNIVITNNVLEQARSAFKLNGGSLPFSFVFENNLVFGHKDVGLSLLPVNWEAGNHVSISRNVIEGCLAAGIYCTPTTSWGADLTGAGPAIIGNICRNNNMAATPDVQIIVGLVGIDHPGGTILGNICGGTEVGSIAVYTGSSGLIDVTGIDWSGHATVVTVPVNVTDLPSNGTRMAHNNALWYHQ